ncbi:MAG TPA: TraM recognition domain-containing protein [Syntrophales bacterium]|nr:TraM recognition domain-containing protein [Syntrophales bacterium]
MQDSDGLSALFAINDKHAQHKKYLRSGITHLGWGVNLKDLEKEIDISIPDSERSGHFGCFGTTRIGKSKLMEYIIEQDIKKGYNVVVIDPKGDPELLGRCCQAAAECGRLRELMMLNPIFPDCSIMLDPLAYYYMEEELVNHVISGIKAKEDYFIAVAQEVSHAVIAGFAFKQRAKNAREGTNDPLVINFHDVKNNSSWHTLSLFKETLKHLPGSEDLVAGIDMILSSPQDFFAKVSSSLRTTLSALTSGTTGRIIGKAKYNEFVRRIEAGEGVILFCNTGSMLTDRTAHIIGRVLLSMIRSMVGRIFASGRKLNPPLCLHLDEGHNILYRGVQELFNKGGGANVWVHFYTQSISQMDEEVGPQVTTSIIDNINTWMYMLVNHPDTAQHMEDASPTIRKYQSILSFGGGMSLREVEEKQIKASKVLQLPKRHFYLRTYGELYRGITHDVSPLMVEIQMPKVA